jgi:hypothetical protein
MGHNVLMCYLSASIRFYGLNKKVTISNIQVYVCQIMSDYRSSLKGKQDLVTTAMSIRVPEKRKMLWSSAVLDELSSLRLFVLRDA